MTVQEARASYRSEPFVEIALIQNESEMLNVPARDLSGFLTDKAAEHRWRWTLFTEQSFDEALARADRFDCLILGYNAIHRSPALREALSAAFPGTGVLVLHQMQAPAFECLREDLTLTAKPLPHGRRDVITPKGVEAHLDIVLSWPHDVRSAVEAPDSAWELVQGLNAPADGAWRVVLQADTGSRRIPVLLRTSAWRNPRLAVCMLLLEPGREEEGRSEHGELLANLISFCARGLPEVVAFPPAAGDAAWKLLGQKLALAGTHAVQVEGRTPAYDGWPELAASTVVVAPGSAGSGADEWQDQGGRLVTLEGRRLVAHEGSSDLRWIARRWAAELAVRPVTDWLGGWFDGDMRRGSILATRAVLRTSELLREPDYRSATGDEPGGLGIPDLEDEELARRIREMLQRRRLDRGHIDETVSTTVAALDLDALIPGDVLRSAVRERAEAWLRERFKGAPAEDKLEIARCLEDSTLFATAIDAVKARPVSPVVLAKAWEAAVACGATVPGDLVAPGGGADELRKSVLVAGSFLTALSGHRASAPWNPPFDVTTGAVDDALATLRRNGSLLGSSQELRGDVESVSTEALALLTLYRRPDRLLEGAPDDGRPDAQVTRPREPLAPVLTEGLLSETARLRVRNAELEESDRLLKVARSVCTIAAVIGSALGVIAIPGAPGSVGDWLTLAGVGILILLAVFALLGRWDLLPAWGQAIARFVGEGISGLPARFRDIAERRTST